MRKIVAIGDSITRGTHTEGGESSPPSVAVPNFAQLVKDEELIKIEFKQEQTLEIK